MKHSARSLHNTHAILRESGVALVLTALGWTAQAAEQPLPCFEEFHQLYERDDGGRTWDMLGRQACAGAPHGKPALLGAKIEVRRSGDDVYFHEDAFSWEPILDPTTNQCTDAREHHRRTTKVIRAGVYYELIETDGKPPRRKQKTGGRFDIAEADPLPSNLDRAPFQDLGFDTLAGHRCRRFRADFGNGQSSLNCMIELAAKCTAARHLLPLESVTLENGPMRTEGRTTLLRTGERGRILEHRAIAPP